MNNNISIIPRCEGYLGFEERSGEISERKRTGADYDNKSIKIHRLKKKSITCSILKVPDDILMLIEQMPKADGDRAGYVFKWLTVVNGLNM